MTQINAQNFEFEENTAGDPGVVLTLPAGSEVAVQPDLFAEMMEAYFHEYGSVAEENSR